jgi:branched-chain amino acid transport system substrate-binding protein
MKKIILLLVLITTGCMSLITFGASKAEEEILIGVTSPNTGPIALYGQSVNEGVTLAIEEINAAGGVLGKKLKVEFLDDKGDATEGANTYNILKGRGVTAIIGSVTSGVTSGIAEKAKADGMILITPTGTADMLTIGKPTVFRSCYTDSYQGRILAKFGSEKLNVKKAAILYCGADEYSLGLYESFRDSSKEFGIEIVAAETSSTMDDVDFSAQLSKIAGSGAEILLVPYYYGTVALIVPQARQAGFTGAIVGADGWDGVQDKIEGNADAFENTYFTNHYSVEDPSPAVQKFVKNFTAKYTDKNLTALAALGYDCVYMLAQAIKEGGKTDSATMAKALSAIKFSGVTGTFTLDENGDPKKGAAIIEIKNGKMKWMTTVE